MSIGIALGKLGSYQLSSPARDVCGGKTEIRFAGIFRDELIQCANHLISPAAPADVIA